MVNKVDSWQWRFTALICLLSFMKLHIILFSIIYEHLLSIFMGGHKKIVFFVLDREEHILAEQTLLFLHADKSECI